MAKLPKPKVGCPTKLNDHVKKIITDQIKLNLSISNAARIARIHPESIKNWMEKGFIDSKEPESSIFGQFFVDVREAQGIKISELLRKMEEGSKNWQSIAWILEKCCAEDFGKDSELYKQLLEDYKKLIQDMMVRKNQPLQGRVVDGEKLD